MRPPTTIRLPASGTARTARTGRTGRTRQARPRLALAAVLAALALATAGCASIAPGPGELPTPTPLPPGGGRDGAAPAADAEEPEPAEPGADGVDPRCAAVFPLADAPLAEEELALRPEAWPEAPSWAVLCATEFENATTQVAWFATDGGIGREEVYAAYEAAIDGVGVHGRSEIAEGEISTGVFPPQHSFWILATGDVYRVTWSLQGEYAD